MTPRQHSALAARIRTDLALVRRSDFAKKYALSDFLEEHVRNDLSACRDSLGYPILVYPPSFGDFGLEYGMSLSERKSALNIDSYRPPDSEDLRRLLSIMADGSQAALSSEWMFRVGQWCDTMSQCGWYPFFVTLTVDPFYHDPAEVFGVGSTALQYFFERLKRLACRAAGVSQKQRRRDSQRDWVQHFFVVEHGKSREHHHAHGIIWLREIPDYLKLDPNRTGDGTKRNCPAISNYWTYCLPSQRSAYYFWTGSCIWQKLGHRTPLDIDGKGITVMPAVAAGLYCCKYMKKEVKEWHHRVKATRNLGLDGLLQTIGRCPLELLKASLSRPPTLAAQNTLTTNISVPLRLLKRLAKLEIYCREYRLMDLKSLLMIRPKPFSAICRSLKAGIRPWLLNSEDFYAWVSSILPPAPVEFCRKKWLDLRQFLVDEGFGYVDYSTYEGLGGFRHG